MLTNGDSSAFTVTWCAVPAFDSPATATVQVSLLQEGAIEIQVSRSTTIRAAIVGLSPGATSLFTPVDLSTDGTHTSGGALGEHFTTTPEIDLVTTSQRFLQTYSRSVRQPRGVHDTKLLSDSFAYEVPVANAIGGINVPSSTPRETSAATASCRASASWTSSPSIPTIRSRSSSERTRRCRSWVRRLAIAGSRSSSFAMPTAGDRTRLLGRDDATGASSSTPMHQCSRATTSPISAMDRSARLPRSNATVCSIIRDGSRRSSGRPSTLLRGKPDQCEARSRCRIRSTGRRDVLRDQADADDRRHHRGCRRSNAICR
jgi:hypothetical protein